jgi:RHS repeat-associated protein
MVETRQYDPLNHLLRLQSSKGSNILTDFVYSLDKTGNRQQVVETLNGISRTVQYTYDDLYRLTKENVTDALNGNRLTEFVYDKVGNRQQQSLTANAATQTTTYQYDVNDRLLKEQINGADKVIYTYDSNGNTLTKAEDGKTTESLWNDRNRLVASQVKDAGGVVSQQVSYEYDASDVRVSQSAGGEVTKYLIDANLPYAQVLVEYRPSGLVLVSYVHGNDLINQVHDGISSFYHVDALGSARLLSDVAGGSISTYNYQAFGELLNSTGSSSNNYLFAGEQFDPILGDYYNRARYYDPQSGRFTKRDDYAGSINEPLTLHKYLYANSDPINKFDSTGFTTIAEASSTVNMLSQLTVRAFTFTPNTAVIDLARSWAIILAAASAGYIEQEIGTDSETRIRVVPNEYPRRKDEEMSQMRLQLQDLPGTTFGIPIINIPEVGVTVSQVSSAVFGLWSFRRTLAPWFPVDHDTALIKAMAGVTKKASQSFFSGGVFQGSSQVYTRQWNKNDPKGNRPVPHGYYRVDFENLRGHNLRNP